MKVFIANTSLASPYGGPARSVSGLATALADAGVDVGLWAPDQSAPTTPFVPRDSPARRLTGSCTAALEAFGHADVVHDNGIWRPHNHHLARLAARRGIPRVVSTRGMLNPWAMNHKGFKKRLAWPLYQRRDLELANCHHVSSQAEAAEVEQLRLGVPICIIPNGVDVPDIDTARSRNASGATPYVKTALFLGRLYPIKGLPMLIDAWAQVRPEGWKLKIAGPDEAGHRKEIERAVEQNGLRNLVSLMGPVDGETKLATFLEADLFVLPSHSESFSLVIGEALGHGIPVLTTAAVPWPQLAEHQCGWRVPATLEGIVDGLREATSVDVASLRMMGGRGRDLVATMFGWGHIARQFVELYERYSVIASVHPRP